jgi:hypothetical protein
MSKTARTFAVALTIGIACAGARAQQASDPHNYYPQYEKFATETYGAEKEDLVYQAFGKELKLLDKGDWLHPSLNSAAVAFETVLPAKAFVEYGKTADYGQKTEPAKRFHYVHLHYVKGLEPATTYHYRIVATDERGNEIKSEDRTFTTIADDDKLVKISGDATAPFELASGKHYIVTADLTVDGRAFNVEKGKDITLDLNGHTVIYNNKAQDKIESGNFWDWINGAAFGVRAMKPDGLKVFNGTIKQGAGLNAAQGNSIGYSPFYCNGAKNFEAAGLTIDYAAPQVVGMYFHWGGAGSRVHHNVFIDRGTQVPNRHGAGCKAVLFYGEGGGDTELDHNLVLRTRQSGLTGGNVHHNEIYVDSWATNSFGIGITNDGKAYNNRVFGTGYHFVGIGWANGIEVYDNFIHAQAEHIEGRFKEYGDQSSVNGIRLTQYAGSKKPYENNSYHGNFIAVYARQGTQARGVQFFSDPYVKNLTFRKNVIKAFTQDAKTKQVACVVAQGNQSRTEEHLPIAYEDCTFISNICNIRFGDYYGVGSNHRFTRCELVKVGDDERYTTFKYDNGYPSKYHVLLDCTFKKGASPTSVSWPDGGKAENSQYTVAWTLKLETTPGAKVTVTDKAGDEACTLTAGEDGKLAIPLKQFTANPGQSVEYTPHTVNVEAGGKTATRTVEMTDTKEMTLKP